MNFFFKNVPKIRSIMNERYLTITLCPDWKSRLQLAAQLSEHSIYQGEELNFESPAQFFGQLTEKRWELVRLAQGKKPITMRALARLVGRDVRRVHEDVMVLLHLGLLERIDKAGVICPFTNVHIDIHLKAA